MADPYAPASRIARVSYVQRGQTALLAKRVAALADRAHDVVAELARLTGRHRLDPMKRAVECGADQLGHPGIEHGEVTAGGVLDVHDAR